MRLRICRRTLVLCDISGIGVPPTNTNRGTSFFVVIYPGNCEENYQMEKFDILLKELMSEYENSGMSIDDFIKSKLVSSGRSDIELMMNLNDSG